MLLKETRSRLVTDCAAYGSHWTRKQRMEKAFKKQSLVSNVRVQASSPACNGTATLSSLEGDTRLMKNSACRVVHISACVDRVRPLSNSPRLIRPGSSVIDTLDS